jgi:hypothetical protein
LVWKITGRYLLIKRLPELSQKLKQIKSMQFKITTAKICLLLALLFALPQWMLAQVVYKDRKLYLNQDDSHYVKATFLTQAWTRYQFYNPGTTIFGYNKKSGADIGLRRFRIQLYSQVTDRLFIYTQVGENNFNNISDRKFGFFVHDAIAEYGFVKKYLSVGMGLTGWSGLSRFSSPAVGSILGVDAPLYLQSTNDVTDQFLRKLAIYAKGKLGKFDYRVIMAHPMAVQKSANYKQGISTNATFSDQPPKMQWDGYFQYQLKDQESNLTPYTTGTYLGQKHVLNVGAGIVYQPDAMWRANQQGDTLQLDMLLVSADVFYDRPLGSKGSALSLYGNVAYFNFGKGYIRNLAVMNPANGDSNPDILNGGGNGFPDYGTGTVGYVQMGYKLRDSLIGPMSLMPYASLQTAFYDRLNHPMVFTDAGLNVFLYGHQAKLTLAYQNRPVYNIDGDLINRKGAFVLQFQAFFN